MAPTEISPVAVELVTDATARLRGAGSPSPRLDAELLVAEAAGRDRSWLLAHPDAVLEPAALVALDGWLGRRAGGEPIAYIRGYKEWLGLRILTDRRALIPRPETELLAEMAIAELAERLTRDQQVIRGWEVASGSGALSVALARRFRAALALGRLQLTASDVSPDALELAADNLAAHGVARLVTIAGGDLLEATGGQADVDLLIANLPYLTSAEADSGVGSLAHEPRLALDGGPDGLVIIRRLLAELPARLAEGGVALLEIGAGQSDAVRSLADALPVAVAVTTRRDLAGIERVVRIERVTDA